MKKVLIIALVIGAVSAVPAQARTHTTHAKTQRMTYGYTYHRLATVKCPYMGCRRTFSHK